MCFGSWTNLTTSLAMSGIAISFKATRMSGAMILAPLKWSILLTMRKPRRKRAVAEKAEPKVFKKVAMISGSWPPKAKLQITPRTVRRRIGLVSTPLAT